MIGGDSERAHCPRCQSEKVWRDGLRKNINKVIQRFICRDCGYRFSDSGQSLGFSASSEIEIPCQVCDGESKNLIVVPENGTTGEISQITQQITDLETWLKKKGIKKPTIESKTKLLTQLMRRGADLNDPESVKLAISEQKWCDGRKRNAVHAYSSLLQMKG